MAEENNDSSQGSLAKDEDASTPRISLREDGFSSLKTLNGRMYEEANMQFRYPQLLKVVSEMKYSPPVSIGLGAINTLINRSQITVEPLPDENATDKARREYLESVLQDMDQSWLSTLQSISTYKEYGFQVSEIVLRRRLKRNGSKYNDGLVGVKGLRNRPQRSIEKWVWSEDGRQLTGVKQNISDVENNHRFQHLKDTEDGLIFIPREKFLLFRCMPENDNPEGVSILRSAYLAYKQLTMLQDHMMIGVAKNVAGIPFAQLPPSYMSDAGTDAEKATFKAVQTILDNIASGKAHSVIFPRMVDPETKQDLFHLEVLDQKSNRVYDVESIIKGLQSNILSVLSCDSITMGAEKGGSLSLQDGDTNLLALAVDMRLKEIAETLNTELIPLLFKMNGWSTERMPKFKFQDVSSVSLDELGKFLQRVASVSLLEMDRQVFNRVRIALGIEPKPDDAPIDKENLTNAMSGHESGAGEGMKTAGEGTSKKPGGEDKSTRNVENAS